MLANDSDPDGDTLSVKNPLCSLPAAAAGTLTSFTFTGPQAGHFTFMPAAGFVGLASFSYKAMDTTSPTPLESPCRTVNLDVQPDQPPYASFTYAPASVRIGESVRGVFVDRIE